MAWPWFSNFLLWPFVRRVSLPDVHSHGEVLALVKLASSLQLLGSGTATVGARSRCNLGSRVNLGVVL